MKVILAAAIVSAGLVFARAERQTPVPLWPDGVSGVSSNAIPTLAAFLPEVTNATRTAIVICPGGAYQKLDLPDAYNCAIWLNRCGVTCFVLKYRTASQGFHHPAMFDDLTRAVRWVRSQTNKFDLNPHHVGVMGISAGGHLAATLMTHFDWGNPKAVDPVERKSSRPDFGILCYPVITMMGEFGNKVSEDNLLGSNAPTKLKKLLSDELHVSYATPPCFLWTSIADDGVPMENALMFAEALRKNGVRFELHVYERGGHCAGLVDGPPSAGAHMGVAEIESWLREHKWAN